MRQSLTAALAYAAALLGTAQAQTAELDKFAGVYAVRGAPEMAFNIRRMGAATALQYTNVRDGATRLLTPDEGGGFIEETLSCPEASLRRASH